MSMLFAVTLVDPSGTMGDTISVSADNVVEAHDKALAAAPVEEHEWTVEKVSRVYDGEENGGA